MQKRKLGSSNLYLSTVGLGTWAIGGGAWLYGWGPQDDRESITTIQRALELGVNWIDTAPAYGLGHSEDIIGKAIQGRRDQVTLATKCGLVWNKGSAQVHNDLNPKSIRKECEASLKRLGVESIDLYQIHWGIPNGEIEDAWGAVADLVKKGWVRYAGVSNFNVAQLKRIQPIHPVTSLQPPYSMLKRGVESELLAYCAANSIGVIAYSPLRVGILTGKFNYEYLATLDLDDWRRRELDFQEPRFSLNVAFVDKLRPLAARLGRPIAHLAIAWVLRRPEVTAAIVGARHPAQIEEVVPAADLILTPEEIAEIDEYIAGREASLAALGLR